MISTLTRGRALVALLGALALASASQAQSPDGDDIQQTVARVAYFSGEVSYLRGDDPDDWQPASLNFPITLGDRLYTASGSRLELQTEGGVIYLAPETDLAAMNLTYEVKQFSLGIGSASFRIRQIDSGESFEVDTPNAAVTFDSAGQYRIDVDRDGNTRVIVTRGHAYVAAAGGEVPLEAGPASLPPSPPAEAETSAGSRWHPATRSFRGGARGPTKRTSQTSRMSRT